MKTIAYFLYEKDFASRWTPVVYYNEKPSKRIDWNVESTPPVLVPEDCLSIDGSPNFGRLQAIYPPPQERDDE